MLTVKIMQGDNVTLSGVIDFFSDHEIGGWVRSSEKELNPITVYLQSAAGDVRVEANKHRVDISTGSGIAMGFSIQIPAGEIINSIVDGRATVVAVCRNEMIRLKIWRPLLDAMLLNKIDMSMLKGSMKFVVDERVHAIGEACLARFRPWKFSQTDRQMACVLTYANDASAWFPYFYRYYTAAIAAGAIYVVTPNPEEFIGYDLASVFSVSGFPYDDNARSQIMSGLSCSLLSLYQWIILCDVDEILVPDPRSGCDFIEMLSRIGGDVSISRGVDVIQSVGEAEFDFGQEVLSQRRFGIPNSAMCKPNLTRRPLNWSGGYHYCNVRPRFEGEGEGFLNLHLKWACARVRTEVANSVKKVAFADPTIAAYALNSVTVDSHPGLSAASGDPVGLRDGGLRHFEKRFERGISFDGDRGLWIGRHFTDSKLLDLWG